MGNVTTVAMHGWKFGNSYIQNLFALQYHLHRWVLTITGRRIAGFASGDTQILWVLLFAFLQSIHYLVWIMPLISEEDRPQKTPRGLKKSYRALEVDFVFAFYSVGFSPGLFIGYAIYPSSARARLLWDDSFHGFGVGYVGIQQAGTNR